MTRLLVLRLSALGDVIHTLPAVATLRGHDVAWVVEAPYAELVETVARVEAIPVRMKQWGRSLLASRADMRAALARMRGADVSVDFQGLVKSAALGWLAGAKTRIGFDKHAIREKPALLFTNRKVPVDTTRHVVDQNLELARSVTPDGQPATVDWEPFLTPVPGYDRRIVLLPGAGKPNKLWPVEHFRELARLLGDRALVVWGPGERELAEAIGTPAPPTNLRELAWVLRHAEVVIGADTGPLHLAAALGTKVIGLYGPTDPRRNGPYGQLHNVVTAGPAAKWMASITVEQVMNMLRRVMA